MTQMPSPDTSQRFKVDVGYGVTVGGQMMPGLPKYRLRPYLHLWFRFQGRCIWVCEDPAGQT